MILTDYVNSLKESVVETSVSLRPSVGDISSEISKLCEESINKWIAKRLSSYDIYLFNNRHYVNISKLRAEISQLYATKGFTGSGFDKLTEEELCLYKTVKEIFVQLESQSLGPELSPRDTAQSLFDREIFYA
jgi:hypothetical protein